MTSGQWFVIATWIVAIALWQLASGWLAVVGQITLALMVITHPLEFLAKRKLFERLGGPMLGHFWKTLVFGLFYWRPLERQLEDAPAS